jgi:glucan biosynthesis protein C
VKIKRQFYLDWLRIIVIASLVPYHASLTYTKIGDVYLYDKNISPPNFLVGFNIFFSTWMMPLLFFISGMVCWYILNSRKATKFISERVKRLLIPSIFGIITICPLTAYFKAINDFNFKGSLIKFYPVFFTRIMDYLGWAHLWFLVYLFVFSLLCLPFFIYYKSYKQDSLREKISSFFVKKNFIYMPLILVIIFEASLRYRWPGFQNLIDDWANFSVYITFFIIGYIFNSNTKIIEKIENKRMHSLLIGLISSVFIVALYFLSDVFYILDSGTLSGYIIFRVLIGFNSYMWVMFFIGFGKKMLNKKNKMLVYLSKASFPFYILHLFSVTAFSYIFLKLSFNPYFEFFLVSILSFNATLLIYEILLGHYGLRLFFGLKVKKQ